MIHFSVMLYCCFVGGPGTCLCLHTVGVCSHRVWSVANFFHGVCLLCNVLVFWYLWYQGLQRVTVFIRFQLDMRLPVSRSVLVDLHLSVSCGVRWVCVMGKSSEVRLLGATIEAGVLFVRVVVCSVNVDILRVVTTVCSVFAKVHLFR